MLDTPAPYQLLAQMPQHHTWATTSQPPRADAVVRKIQIPEPYAPAATCPIQSGREGEGGTPMAQIPHPNSSPWKEGGGGSSPQPRLSLACGQGGGAGAVESWQRQPAAAGRVEKMISNPEKCRPDGGPESALGGEGGEEGKEEVAAATG